MDGEKYRQQMEKQRKAELLHHAKSIAIFQKKCRKLGIDFMKVKINHIPTIGIVAEYPELLTKIKPEIICDKEGLTAFNFLKQIYSVSPINEGNLIGKDHIAFASSIFRRGMSCVNNWAPRFIQLFWAMDNPEIDTYIALDLDRVRLNVDNSCYVELDTWFGAPFKRDIRQIEDGNVKLRPPMDLDTSFISFMFNGAYSLDIRWKTVGTIKSFYALEFKQEDIVIPVAGRDYHPTRYIHAEFDVEQNCFRHFDGAIQYFTDEEYFERRDSDFNHDRKGNNQIKPMSKKSFKLNGKISTEIWKEFSSHFFSGNPLMYEYYSGALPGHVAEAVERYQAR